MICENVENCSFLKKLLNCLNGAGTYVLFNIVSSFHTVKLY